MTPVDLKIARKGLGLSIKAFARLMGVNERTVRRWESEGNHWFPPPYVPILLSSLRRMSQINKKEFM